MSHVIVAIVNGVERYVTESCENFQYSIVLDGEKILAERETYIKLSKEGRDRGTYIDKCVPLDKYDKEISPGDVVYCSVKGEVEKAEVIKIAEVPYHLGYGICVRKLNVKCVDTGKTWVLSDPSRVIRISE
jgi:hypothetical protein